MTSQRREGRGKRKDEFPSDKTRKGRLAGRKEEFDRIRGREDRRGETCGAEELLLIYALKMPIDIHRYCHSRVAQAVSRLQPKLKLHFTMVFQVVAKLSRNFNIPRRERLKIQPLLVIPSPRSTADPRSSSSRRFSAPFSVPLPFISDPLVPRLLPRSRW